MASPCVYAAVSCGQLRMTRAEMRGVVESKGTAGGRASALLCGGVCMPGGSAGGRLSLPSLAFLSQAARQSAATMGIVRTQQTKSFLRTLRRTNSGERAAFPAPYGPIVIINHRANVAEAAFEKHAC